MIIAIDGEASTGKSTQAKKIAKRLNINYRDSGAYYRAITLFLIQNQINPKEIIGSDIFSKIDIKNGIIYSFKIKIFIYRLIIYILNNIR